MIRKSCSRKLSLDSLFIGFMVLICASFRSCHNNNTKCGQLKVLELPTKVL